MNNNKLKRGITYVFIASVINLFFRLFTNFILPKYLSIDSYAMIKTYQLYISYAGLFALGYIDGMYIDYGGKEICLNNKEDLINNLATCRFFQFIISICIVIISVIYKNVLITLFGISLFSTNIISYFHNLYQATGNFKSYSKITSFSSIFTFLINFVLLILFKEDNAIYYIIGYILLNSTILIVLEIKTYQSLNGIKVIYFSFKTFVSEVKSGILLTLGQLSSTILTGLDRWFVKFFMNTFSFAQYSFSVSLENFVNIAITPITVTLYNTFCKKRDKEYVIKIYNIMLIVAAFLISTAFGIKFITINFLEKYIDSINTVFILFASQLFYILIKSIFINLYKAEKKQRKYFTKLCIVIFLGIINNFVLYRIKPVKEAFAFGTLLCSIEWFIMCIKDFNNYCINAKSYFFIIIELVLFLCLGFFMNAIVGFILYITITIILSIILYKDIFIFLIQYAMENVLLFLRKVIKK